MVFHLSQKQQNEYIQHIYYIYISGLYLKVRAGVYIVYFDHSTPPHPNIFIALV